MSYITRIRKSKPGLTKSFEKLADFLLDYYTEAAFMTATQLAKHFSIDTATVVRFAQHLGYEGYLELIKEIQDQVKQDLGLKINQESTPGSNTEIISSARDELILALEQTFLSLDQEAISTLVIQLSEARRIIIMAEGPAQPAAYNLARYLELGSFPVTLGRPGVAGTSRSVRTASREDLIIVIDLANEAPYFAPALREARGKGISTAVIAGSPSLASTNSADNVLTARANAEIGVEIITIEAITHVLSKVIRHRFSDRYEGVEEAIDELSSMLF